MPQNDARTLKKHYVTEVLKMSLLLKLEYAETAIMIEKDKAEVII